MKKFRPFKAGGALAAALLVAGGIASSPSGAATGDDVLINEILISTTGADPEYLELIGSPGLSLEGLSVIGAEADVGADVGTIDFRQDFAAADVIGDNGFLLVGNDLVAAQYGVTPDVLISQNAFENSSTTYALVATDSLADGLPAATLDSVHITDDDNDPALLGAPSLGPDGSFLPAGVGRLVDGVDTDDASDWGLLSFNNDSPPNTPTAGAAPVAAIVVSIPEIQSAGHLSPFAGELVATTGVVTAAAFRGFYMQDLSGDDDPDTSDGIFVSSNDAVSAGDLVEVVGVVEENIGGGAATGNLSTTQLNASALTIVGSTDLPTPVEIGKRGVLPPNTTVISPSELPVNLQEEAGVFNPTEDAIDFWESLEGMYVEVDRPVAVGATRTFNAFSSEFFVLPSRGERPVVFPFDSRTARGGLEIQAGADGYGDLNAERVQIQLDGTIYPGDVPAYAVGTKIRDIRGVVGYSFGNFEVNATEELRAQSNNLKPEIADLKPLGYQVSVASYNVLNLDPTDTEQLQTVGNHIGVNLRSPDIVALQEIQDNNGTVDDGTTAADLTLAALVDAIIAAGGPEYVAVDIAPENNTQGGAPGGNIRNAFLYNPARVSLLELQDLNATVLASIGVSAPDAFEGSRIPLLARFDFQGEDLTIINNHFSSRFGSTPIFGGPQPFVQAGEAERGAQAMANNEVVQSILDDDPTAAVMVVGDLNTFQFTDELTEVMTADRALFPLLDNLIPSDADDKYTFIFDGNSQMLDHMFISSRLTRSQPKMDIVHVNVDFARVDSTVGSDHEPLLARFKL